MNRVVKTSDGFSMTELLVVVAAILILVSLLFVVGGRMYGQSRLLQCQHHLEQIGRAMNMYSVGHQGTLPAPRSLGGRLWYETLAATHLDDGRILGCPLVGPPPHIRLDEVPVVAEQPLQRFDKALYWLRNLQIKDGSRRGQIPLIEVSGGQLGYQQHNVNTALALMAFLGAGCNDRHPPEFADTVRMAVEFLTGNGQWSDGQFKGELSGYAERSQTIGSTSIPIMALAAAYKTLEDSALRSRARQSAELGLQWLNREENTAWYGGYGYSGPCVYESTTWGERSRMSNAIWPYIATGMARQAGFHIPAHLNSAMNYVLHLNEMGGGRMRFRWNPSVHTDSGDNRHMGRFGWGSVIRLSHGESASSYLVRSQLAEITALTSSGIPQHMSEFSNGLSRFHWFHASRSLRLAGGQEWEQWLNPTPEYGWQGLPHYIAMYLIDDGYDDEGYAMGYWPDNQNIVRGYDGHLKRAYVTSYSAMMFSDVFEDSWLDEDYIPPAERTTSYGYNHLLGRSRATVPASTIVVMDYDNWLIQRGTGDPEEEDDDSRIALRHLGRANALMGDGSVRSLYLEEITPRGRWTLERGD